MPLKEKWQPCPRCGSSRVERQSLFLIGLVGFGCSFWIPIVGWVLAPVFAVLAVIGLIRAIVSRRPLYRCKECNNWWAYDPSLEAADR